MSNTYLAVWFPKSHQVDNESCGGNEEQFHQRIVSRNIVHEEVNVSHAEYDQINLLCFARQT